TTSPVGATTKRISSSMGRTSRLTAHIRVVADFSVRGPLSSSGSARASMRRPSPATELRRCRVGGFGRYLLLGEIGLADPAGLDAGLHDQLFRLVAGDFDAVERAGVLGRFAALLALGPADQIVGAQPARSSTVLMSFSPNFTSIF